MMPQALGTKKAPLRVKLSSISTVPASPVALSTAFPDSELKNSSKAVSDSPIVGPFFPAGSTDAVAMAFTKGCGSSSSPEMAAQFPNTTNACAGRCFEDSRSTQTYIGLVTGLDNNLRLGSFRSAIGKSGQRVFPASRYCKCNCRKNNRQAHWIRDPCRYAALP